MKTAIQNLTSVSEATRQFIIDSNSASTRRAYASDLKLFVAWCAEHKLDALPSTPTTVADFLSAQAQAGISPATLNRRLAAIKYAHALKDLPSPTHDKLVTATLKGIKRYYLYSPKQKTAATSEKLITMLAHCNLNTLAGKRDKALLLTGFAGALRRSELAALRVEDVEFCGEGLRLTIRQSKTDQEGMGQQIAIPNGRLNTVTILQDWLSSAAIQEGYVFRGFYKGGKRLRNNCLSGQAIADIVKAYALKAGFDPAEFAGHSLRAGFVTSAAESGASLFKIMDVSRHKSVQTVHAYVRSADAFKDHAGRGFL